MKKLEPKKLKVVVSICLYDSMDVCQSTEQACQCDTWRTSDFIHWRV